MFWACGITGKTELQQTIDEMDCITALDFTRCPKIYLEKTNHWVRHCQLSWDRTGPKPNWVNEENMKAWTNTGNKLTAGPPTGNERNMPNWLVRTSAAIKALLGGTIA